MGARITRRAVALFAALALVLHLAGQARALEASTAVGAHAMVVSAHRLASEVGRDILQHGGNAVDAAVGVAYALAVVYPQAGNLGGGGFMTIRLADGRTIFLDFREKAPLAATPNMFQDEHGAALKGRSTETWLAVGVPGSVAGLDDALAHFGTLSRAAVIAPAIKLARDGFELGETDVGAYAYEAERLAQDPAARAIFTRNGQPLRAGDRLVQPQLAASLEAISQSGYESFRTGAVGQAIAAASKAGGGLITTADFQGYKVRELTPVHCTYRGFDIDSAPPPSSGGATLCEILNILEGSDLHALGFHSVGEVHALVEAMRRAYRDRNTELGDPDFVTNPVARLIDKAYAAKLRAGIVSDRATPSASLGESGPDKEGQQTTHLSVVDATGNAVSLTTTLNDWFGVHRVAGETGILMNNEMDDFTSAPGTPNMFGLVQGAANAVAPGKTPLSSMSPTIVSKGGRLVMVTGSPGGSRIITITLETIINVIDHGMTVGEAVSAPRIHHQFLPDVVDLELGALNEATRATLTAQGYTFRDRPFWGHAESILIGGPTIAPTSATSAARQELRFGSNDPRAPAGAALGY